MKLSGPSLWLRYESKPRTLEFDLSRTLHYKKLDLFGEQHTNERLCEEGVYISDFFARVAEIYYKEGRHLDIFLETAFITERGSPEDFEYWPSCYLKSPLLTINKRFVECLKENKESNQKWVFVLEETHFKRKRTLFTFC
jgi:hypothetical protein